jgi:hypothetical protein
MRFVATRRGDPERGPQVRLNTEEARIRLVEPGALIWVYGPRRHDLAEVVIDDTVPKGGVIVRDIAGLAVAEIVRLVRTDTADRPILQTPKLRVP